MKVSTDSASDDCSRFLHWCLPRLSMRYEGFRNVRRQVCRHLAARMAFLGLSGFSEYGAYLERHSAEWSILDGICRIHISRFYRDKRIFDTIITDMLPSLCTRAIDRPERLLRVWSAGCAAGQEPYTMRILWSAYFGRFEQAGLRMDILATDIDEEQLDRCRRARYQISALKELPQELREIGFERSLQGEYLLREEFRETVRFERQDIRRELAEGRFDLILCRNLVFTYFDEALQKEIGRRIAGKLVDDGFLVLGSHEAVPGEIEELVLYRPGLNIYQKK